MKHNLSFVVFLTSLIFISCSNDEISSDENLSSLINPDFNLFSRFHDCSIKSKKNLNDLEQFIPIFQSNREFTNNNELYIPSFIIFVLNVSQSNSNPFTFLIGYIPHKSNWNIPFEIGEPLYDSYGPYFCDNLWDCSNAE